MAARSVRLVPGLALQLGRFAVVGVSNTLVSLVVYLVLVEVGVTYWIAAAIAFAAGAVNGYVLNRRWTFAVADSAGARVRYVLVQACGLGATSGLLSLLVAGAGLGQRVAYLVVLPVVTLGTFAANRAWTFAARHAPAT